MTSSYNSNGRLVVNITQKGGGRNWQEGTYKLETAARSYKGLDFRQAAGMLRELPVRPVIEYQGKVAGKARKYFREVVSSMSLSELSK